MLTVSVRIYQLVPRSKPVPPQLEFHGKLGELRLVDKKSVEAEASFMPVERKLHKDAQASRASSSSTPVAAQKDGQSVGVQIRGSSDTRIGGQAVWPEASAPQTQANEGMSLPSTSEDIIMGGTEETRDQFCVQGHPQATTVRG